MKTNILIVDDDREIAQAIAFYLRNEGYEPIIALDGIEALNLIRSTPVSLIIMDVMMPGLDGIQTTLRIREEHNIPIIRIPYFHLSKLCLEDLILETSIFKLE